MSLTFGICWIEDQASEAEIDKVSAAVRASGFEPAIERIETEDDIREFADRQIHHNDFDLILLDLNLGMGLRGDELAGTVRAAFRSTTILFYSATDEAILRAKMADKQVEGVYCVHRDRLSMRVGELVAHLSPALNRLSSMRGLASRVVAECDQDFRAILTHLGSSGLSTQIYDSLKSRVHDSANRQEEEIDKVTNLDGILSSHYVHSGALYLEVKERAQARGGDEVLTIVRKLRKGYPNQVLGRRNTLAHALEKRGDTGWQIIRTAGDPVTVDDFPRYRAEFQTQLELVRRLRKILLSQ